MGWGGAISTRRRSPRGPPKREMFVSEKASDHACTHQQGSGDVGSGGIRTGEMTDGKDRHGQQDWGQENSSAIDYQTTQPFSQVVALRLEDKPFVVQESDGDIQHSRERSGEYVGVGNVGGENDGQDDVARIAKDSVEDANCEIASKLPRRDVAGEFGQWRNVLQALEHNQQHRV